MIVKIKDWLKVQFDKAEAFTFDYTVAHWAYIVVFVVGFALGLTVAW